MRTSEDRWARCEEAYQTVLRMKRAEMVEQVGERSYQVWAEGYAATGESAGAQLLGVVIAPSFRAACDVVMQTPERQQYYDREKLSYWSCRLFDNRGDAMRAFG
jgi:hypothetical protein